MIGIRSDERSIAVTFAPLLFALPRGLFLSSVPFFG